MPTPTAPPTTAAIEVTGLRRSFGDTLVLDGVDLHVPEGTVLALLGPNGAGKTTIVKTLSTLITADAGTARIAGHDVVADAEAVRSVIGLTGQFSAVDDLLTGRENLRLMADLEHLDRAKAKARIVDLLERFELLGAADRPAVTYSGGMRRRLDLAMTLVGSPRVLFLDEPTTGLDPRSRRELWRDIRDLVRTGVTILLTTQYLEEADHLADRIAVLDHGRIVAQGTANELKRRVPGGHVRLELPDAAALEQAVTLVGWDLARDDEALTLQVPSDGSLASLRGLIDRLEAAAVDVTSLTVHTPDLNDVFLTLTGQPATVATDPETDR